MKIEPAQYTVRRLDVSPDGACDWDGVAWRDVPRLIVGHFFPAGSDHRPVVEAKLGYTAEALHVLFRVEDRYVKSVTTEFQGPVYKDSCVELFVRPKADQGYFNFETNCGGAMLIYCIEDATRVGDGFARFTKVSLEDARRIRVGRTMPETTPVEISGPIDWRIELAIPFAMMEKYVGPIGDVSGQTWRANLYKCGDGTSHPHWGSWAAVGEKCNFHQPARFGELRFE